MRVSELFHTLFTYEESYLHSAALIIITTFLVGYLARHLWRYSMKRFAIGYFAHPKLVNKLYGREDELKMIGQQTFQSHAETGDFAIAKVQSGRAWKIFKRWLAN